MLNTVIFDMDGVLLDSEAIYLESLRQCLLSVTGRDLPIPKLSQVIGMSMTDITEKLIQEYDIHMSVRALIELQNEYFDRVMADTELKEIDGLTDFLQYLKERGYKIGLASSSELAWIKEVLYNLGVTEYFDLLVSGEAFEHSKPDPEIYNYAVDHLKAKKYETIVIEDSRNGVMAAKNAGLKVVAFKGASIKQETDGADYTVHSYREMKTLFDEIGE